MGVLMSAWASTQIRHRSGHCWAWPPTEPMARLDGGRRSVSAWANRTNTLLPSDITSCPPTPPPPRLPVVAPQHDQRVARCDGSAGGAGQHLIGAADAAGKVHVHEGLVLLHVAEVEVAKVVDGVV